MSAADPGKGMQLTTTYLGSQDDECRRDHAFDLRTLKGGQTGTPTDGTVSTTQNEDRSPQRTTAVDDGNAEEGISSDQEIKAYTGINRLLDDISGNPDTSEETETHDTAKSCEGFEKSPDESNDIVIFKKPLEPKASRSGRLTRWGGAPLDSSDVKPSSDKAFTDDVKRRVEDWVLSVAARASSLGATPGASNEGLSKSEDKLASCTSPADVSKEDADNDPTLPVGEQSQMKPRITEKRIQLLSGVLKLYTKEGEESALADPGPSGGPALITPLPDGQFYNIKPAQNGRTPRAIYRKRDTDGVPVVFTSKIPDVSFWDLNPNHFARDIRAVAGEEIASHRMTNYGSLVVYVKTGEVAHKLLKLTSIAELPVSVHVPRSYSKNLGKIRTVPFHYTDRNLVNLLASVGVVKARRQMRTLRKEDGTNVRRSRSNVVLTFRDDIELPAYVRLGFFKFPVEPYVEAPMQCRNCQGFWHSSRGCRREARCRTCAGPHHFTVCTFKARPRCANCRGPHTAIHFRCPVKYEAYKKKCWQLAHL